MNDRERLRSYLGEQIPDGGTDSDTMFPESEIDDLLGYGGATSNIYLCAAEGWRRKAGVFANLVNVSEAGSSRSNSNLHDAALKQEEHYRTLAITGVGRGRTRTAPIRRIGGMQ